jgi:Fe-S-cluster containining protein
LITTEAARAVGDMRVAREAIVSGFTRRSVHIKPTPSCDQGCAHCCYWPVSISILEGLEIYTHLHAARRWASSLKSRVKASADAVTGLTYPVWLNSRTPCVFLNKSLRCEIYEARPLLCRMAVSKGPPEECQPHSMASARSILNRTDAVVLFQNAERSILQRHKIEYNTMPIPTATLVAERLCNGEFEFWQAGAAVFAEHLGRY